MPDAPEPVEWRCRVDTHQPWWTTTDPDEAESVRADGGQVERVEPKTTGEPVAWLWVNAAGDRFVTLDADVLSVDGIDVTPLYEHPTPVPPALVDALIEIAALSGEDWSDYAPARTGTWGDVMASPDFRRDLVEKPEMLARAVRELREDADAAERELMQAERQWRTDAIGRICEMRRPAGLEDDPGYTRGLLDAMAALSANTATEDPE